jgi:penicillin-binding protein 2
MRRNPLFDSFSPDAPGGQDDAPLAAWRLRVFAVVLGALIATLTGRLWFLQILNGEEHREKAEGGRKRQVRLFPPRGTIQDSKGRNIVVNDRQFTVFIDPTYFPKKDPDRGAVLARLAEILGKPVADLEAAMKKNRGGPSDPIALVSGIDQHTLARINDNKLATDDQPPLTGVEVYPEPLRRYPHGTVAAHLVGYIGPITEKQLKSDEAKSEGYRPGDLMGQTGVEREYDAFLNGVAGSKWGETDARGRWIRDLDYEEPRPGATLRLALDVELQKVAEAALGDRHGAVVALDPRDGRVLAMVSYPRYDPNLLARRPLNAKVYTEQIAPGMFNRATMAQQAPGSTFKIVTAAAGLSLHKISGSTGFSCGGGIQLGPTFKKCHGTHGGVTLNSAMAQSCDVYFYQTGFLLGPEKMARWAREHFGIGSPTGIDLPSEQEGLMPDPAWQRREALRNNRPEYAGWFPGMTANVAIGQGAVLTTPLQMALVVSAIANGGTVYAPRVLLEATDWEGKTVYRMEPKPVRKLDLSPEEIGLIAKGLRSVVTGGTARSAEIPGVGVAGKTGTAEQKGQKGMGEHANDAWFVCYAPYEKPTIALCVYLESHGQNYHGGTDAAPVAKKVMEKYFGIAQTPVAPKKPVR